MPFIVEYLVLKQDYNIVIIIDSTIVSVIMADLTIVRIIIVQSTAIRDNLV